MATFKACVQWANKQGIYQVFIRVTHNRKSLYIKTDKMLTEAGLSKNKEIIDPIVLKYCSVMIVDYIDRLNRLEDIHNWSCRMVVDFLSNGEDICFSDYARKHIDGLIDNGQERTARNYELSLRHLERHIGTNKVMFSQMTSSVMREWIKSLSGTSRAKEMYPVCMRQVYRAAINDFNDYDLGIIRIKINPWVKVQIPQSDRPEKRAITAEDCRAFFAAPLPETKMLSPLPEIGRDVAMLVFCLAGMNSVDIYNLRKSDYHRGVVHYRRAKTSHSRTDGAYFEMRVPEIIKPLFEKYAASEKSEYLFNFYERFSSSDSFGTNANNGIYKICKSMGIPKENWYSVYTFRHTWATIAQNDCGASIPEVAFAMNHSQRHNVTRGYIKIDFSPAWQLNERVIDFVFFTDKASKQAEKENSEQGIFRISAKTLIRAAAFFKGKCLASFDDIGYSNVDEVISRLVCDLPPTIPDRSIVLFKIVNCDNEKVAVYERQKGKGFF